MKSSTLFKTIAAVSLCCLSAFVAPTATRKLALNKIGSVMSYTMSHPLHTWDGVSHDVLSVLVYNDATDRIEAVAVAAKIASFDSHDANRDSHAIEILDGIKYPRVTFSSTAVEPTGPKFSVRGNLTFHGVSKPIVFDAQRADKGGQIVVTGEFPVKMSDYKVERPSLMMVPTDESFTIKFSLVYNRGDRQN
jgi:polyisoprenoid-binding protein YceI